MPHLIPLTKSTNMIYKRKSRIFTCDKTGNIAARTSDVPSTLKIVSRTVLSSTACGKILLAAVSIKNLRNCKISTLVFFN
jgi:hypothetical protein